MSDTVKKTRANRGSKNVLPALVEDTATITPAKEVSDETVKKFAEILSEKKEVIRNSKDFAGTSKILDLDNMPDLRKVKPKNIDLSAEYWSPETGEIKVLVFMKLVYNDEIPDFNDSSKTVLKDCAYFITQNDKGDLQVLKCAASRLVSVMKSASVGEVFQVTHTGKTKNKTNNFLSSSFRINPVIVE